MKWIVLALFFACDAGAYFSVPKPVRLENAWGLVPGCGFVLASAYHFGNKMQAVAAAPVARK